MSNSLQPHELQHTRLPCPSLSSGVRSNSYPLSQWCYLTISSSVVPLSFWLQSFPVSGPFPKSQFFISCGQKIGVSASASVLPMNIQDWLPLGLTGLIYLQSKVLLKVFSSTTIQMHQFLSAQPSLWSSFHIHTWLLEKPKLWLCRPLLAKWYLCFLIQLSRSVTQLVKNLPAMRETWVQSLGWEYPLEKGIATHPSVLDWKIPWTEEPGGLQSMGLQKVRHD